jgi:8-amino-7-oxononanoate synthase
VKQLSRRLEADPRVGEARLARRIRRYPYYIPIDNASLPTICVEGEELINLGSNNYLGLSMDPRLVEAAVSATRQWGCGVTGSRLLNGTLRLHEELEALLAKFLAKEAALVFPTGYTANLGLMSGLLEPGDRVTVDEEIHASVIDALAMARSRFRRFSHNDPSAAAAGLGARTSTGALVIEGIYSMRGDAAPVAAFADVADAADALLIVDEAHGIGTVGAGGRGGAARAGALERVDALTVTFSKSLASCGGAVVGSRDLIEALKARARPFMFTASNTPASVASALRALQVLIDEPELVADVASRTDVLRQALTSHGVPLKPSDGPILTVPVGSDFETVQAWRLLRNRGVFCNPVLSPAVPKGEGLLRLSVMRTHTDDQLGRAAKAFSSIRRWTVHSRDNASLEPTVIVSGALPQRQTRPSRMTTPAN